MYKILAAGAALLVLGALSAWLLRGGQQENPLIARVNGVAVHLQDVQQKVAALALGDQIDVREQLPRFAQSVVQEELLFQYGLSGPLRDELKAAAVERLIQRLVKDRIDVSNDEVRQFFDQHIDEIRGEHVRVRQLQMARRADCENLQPQLDNEDQFIAAVREHSINQDLAERDGDMGYLMRHFDLLGFEAELFGLPLNQPHLFTNDDGCYLMWISEYLDPPPPPLSEVSDNIRQRLSREREIELLQQLLQQAEQAVTVERFLFDN